MDPADSLKKLCTRKKRRKKDSFSAFMLVASVEMFFFLLLPRRGVSHPTSVTVVQRQSTFASSGLQVPVAPVTGATGIFSSERKLDAVLWTAASTAVGIRLRTCILVYLLFLSFPPSALSSVLEYRYSTTGTQVVTVRGTWQCSTVPAGYQACKGGGWVKGRDL
ncbi:hypothetical protein HOY80DRAFT_2666 [Tuber brumale]|nr:hypothetical protein HOY80DRAFT_2666 [Tuber brumale]